MSIYDLTQAEKAAQRATQAAARATQAAGAALSEARAQAHQALIAAQLAASRLDRAKTEAGTLPAFAASMADRQKACRQADLRAQVCLAALQAVKQAQAQLQPTIEADNAAKAYAGNMDQWREARRRAFNECPICSGTGQLNAGACPSCAGHGTQSH